MSVRSQTIVKIKTSLSMSSQKLWRPFEDKPEDRKGEEQRAERLPKTNVIYTFDLNRQRSQPIGYVMMSPTKQLVSSQTSIHHLSGNQMSIPIAQSTAQSNWSKVRQRYMEAQPRFGYEESRAGVVATERAKFRCDYDGCDKTFVYKSALESHRLVHSSERKFCCSLCNKKYKQLSGLYSHQSVKHTDRSQRFVCNDCHYAFADYRNLRIHEYNQHFQTGVNQQINNAIYNSFEPEI